MLHYVSMLAVIGVFIALWLLAGNYAWTRMARHAQTHDELDAVVASTFNGWMMFGKLVLILSWPVWTVGVWAVLQSVRAFRAAVPTMRTFP